MGERASFIPFGINPSALTAVTLAPLYHPLQLVEQAITPCRSWQRTRIFGSTGTS